MISVIMGNKDLKNQKKEKKLVVKERKEERKKERKKNKKWYLGHWLIRTQCQAKRESKKSQKFCSCK